jgi:diguanylate cyclase (GGDEF)-like protein
VRGALLLGLILIVAPVGLDLLTSRPAPLIPYGIRLGLLAPVFLLAIGASFLPHRRRLFQSLLAATALLVALGFVALNLTGPAETRQMSFATLPVVIAFVYFALGLFLRTASFAAVSMIVAYLIGAQSVGVAPEQITHNLAVLLVATVICGVGSYILHYALRTGYLEKQLLAELVERDGLTGLYNRRAFDRHLESAWAIARRQRSPLCLALVDIDFFKAYNDQHGHQAGDECLRRVAAAVGAAARRPLDFAGRYGGEEFILLLYDADADTATVLLENLRNRIASARIPHRASSIGPVVTVSIGAASVSPAETARSLSGVIQLADQSLYDAKSGGRNQVVMQEAAEVQMQTGVFQPIELA